VKLWEFVRDAHDAITVNIGGQQQARGTQCRIDRLLQVRRRG